MTNSQKELYISLGLVPSKVESHKGGTISYNGDVDWDNKTFSVFPLKFRKVYGYFSCGGCTNLVSLAGAPREVLKDFYCSYCVNLTSLSGAPREVRGDISFQGCVNLRSLGRTLKSVIALDIEGTPVYNIPEDLAVTNVWLNGPNKYILADETRKVLQDFKSSITSDDDAGEVLLDRMNRPRWQIAYVTDYLNRDIQV